MSKRSNEGDVLSNRGAVGVARELSLVASLLGPQTALELQYGQSNDESDVEDAAGGDGDEENCGVGAEIPKDILDGSFTHRVPGSDDKLLQQLIGKKAAKAHLASKQAGRTNLKRQTNSKPQPSSKHESEDEEEGRASAFSSKKKRLAKPKPKAAESGMVQDGDVEDDVEDEAVAMTPQQLSSKGTGHEREVESERSVQAGACSDQSDPDRRTSTSTARTSKTGSYLDEILSERSKKKQRKRHKEKTDT